MIEQARAEYISARDKFFLAVAEKRETQDDLTLYQEASTKLHSLVYPKYNNVPLCIGSTEGLVKRLVGDP